MNSPVSKYEPVLPTVSHPARDAIAQIHRTLKNLGTMLHYKNVTIEAQQERIGQLEAQRGTDLDDANLRLLNLNADKQERIEELEDELEVRTNQRDYFMTNRDLYQKANESLSDTVDKQYSKIMLLKEKLAAAHKWMDIDAKEQCNAQRYAEAALSHIVRAELSLSHNHLDAAKAYLYPIINGECSE